MVPHIPQTPLLIVTKVLLANSPSLLRSTVQQFVILHVWDSGYLYIVSHLTERQKDGVQEAANVFNKKWEGSFFKRHKNELVE